MNKIRKAIIAGIGAGAGALITAASDDGIQWGVEGWIILGTTLGVFAATYAVPNSGGEV